MAAAPLNTTVRPQDDGHPWHDQVLARRLLDIYGRRSAMGHATHVVTSMPPKAPIVPPPDRTLGFRFQSLILAEPESWVAKRSLTMSISLLVHTVTLALVVVLPLLIWDASLPTPDDAVRAFFVTPVDLAPPPPPPPPPPAGTRAPARAPAPVRPAEPARFTAPVIIPDEVIPEEGLDLGVEGGVAGGVEGGVPGGVLGGIVGGLPSEAPPPPPTVVRVGGHIKAPKLVHRVEPEYPMLGVQARLSAIVILEARVDTSGRVVAVSVLRSHAIFDEAAIAAVRQWRYQPLLLNGLPTQFVLAVTVAFMIQQPAQS